MAAIYITVPSGVENRHAIPPDTPGTADDVVDGVMAMWKAGEKIMLPDGMVYEREQVMAFRVGTKAMAMNMSMTREALALLSARMDSDALEGQVFTEEQGVPTPHRPGS